MLGKIALAVALALSVALSWSIYRGQGLKADNAALSASLAALTAKNELTKSTLLMMSKRAEAEAERQFQTKGAIEALLTGDLTNGDETIDPAIMRVLNCMRAGANAVDCP